MCEMGKVMTDERIEANGDSGDDAAKKTMHERAREMRKRTKTAIQQNRRKKVQTKRVIIK